MLYRPVSTLHECTHCQAKYFISRCIRINWGELGGREGGGREEGVFLLSVLPFFLLFSQPRRILELALNIMNQPPNSQNGSWNVLPGPQENTEPHSGKAKTEPHPIQIPFSNPHSHNCTEMSKHKQTGALAAHLISTKHCRIAADMTRVFKQAGFRQTHTPHFREASQARLKTRHCNKPKQTVNITKWTTISFRQKRRTDSASKFFFFTY